MNGAVLPVLMLGILVLILMGSSLLIASEKGPWKHACTDITGADWWNCIWSTCAETRMCFAGSIRDIMLMKNFDLFSVIAALFGVMLIYNIATGNFHLGFSGQPFAHAQHLWNIVGMYIWGWRQPLQEDVRFGGLLLAGQGSSDAAVTVAGMFVGSALCHNLKLASAAAAAATAETEAVVGESSIREKLQE